VKATRLSRAVAILTLVGTFPMIGFSATIIYFGSDLVNESNQNRTIAGTTLSVTGINVLITPHPAWEPNHVGANWVSFALTGDGQIAIPNNAIIDSNFPQNATANFYESFTLSGIVNSASIRVWADDTVAVYLNGFLIQAPNPVQDSACAAGSIACQPFEGLLIDLKSTGQLQSGSNTLMFSVFQRESGPFGILYDGSADITAIPEPASITLFSGGLINLIYYARRRKRITPQ
jgi:hypothetical protein